MITVTETAASHLQDLLKAKDLSPSESGLRLMVEKGGCAGLSYAMKLDQPAESDEIIRSRGVMFMIAADSQSYLKGCEIDYVDALSDSGFRIHNPNAVRSCGCGTSFEAAKDGPIPAAEPVADGVGCGT